MWQFGKYIVCNVMQLFAVADKYTKIFDYSRTTTIIKATFRKARKPLLQKTVVVGCINFLFLIFQFLVLDIYELVYKSPKTILK